jgi:hypothetical protein
VKQTACENLQRSPQQTQWRTLRWPTGPKKLLCELQQAAPLNTQVLSVRSLVYRVLDADC